MAVAGPQVAAEQIAHGVHARPRHLGNQAGRLAEGDLRDPCRDLPVSTGWKRTPAATGITGSGDIARHSQTKASWNWLARSVVQGRPEPEITRSAPSLAAK